MPPEAPRFVMLGSWFNFVVFTIDATMALGNWISGCARFPVLENWGTYTRPRLSRRIKPILTRVFKLRFQKTGIGNTARNRSVAELTAGGQLVTQS